ncbi:MULTISPECIES: LamG-like jellyroll fold domain-containing protein [unclassified Lentimicrobium]|uniref:LamG-like jellyroll fold domain-containing protein n=1 Tax=unclassified Lentimicrobium TaxID=2677434 RepID=UPI001557113C|nr:MULTISPECIES: LamG-like jellyroll fold domain-containing protein [unclassified Lentimicrobium]NPD47417.1 hypothetical protein [Lentimicrobium sp. S6]NPD85097.1 hypothetical protein [Lentimicrobium sp. L6]
MKKSMNFLMLFSLMMAISVFVTGCSEDDDPVTPAGDKTALTALIVDCEALYDGAQEGTSVGFYEVGSKEVFKTAIDAANAVPSASAQSVMDAAEVNLEAAKTIFEGKFIQNVSTDGLVAYWLFDGDATDFTGNGNDGVLSAGHAAFGGGMPALTTDRFGNENNAYYFNEGGFINVPYTLALNPANISISLWVNATEIRENNRFMGLQSWNGFKYQLQSVNKSFFTASTDDGIYDKDTDPVLEVLTWYHLTVTYESGSMIFYVNGAKQQEYTDVTGGLVKVEDHDLAIGCGSSKYADDDSNYDNDHIIPAAWGGYFNGKLDDIRLYNRVLTGAEVSSIYNLEKP